MDFNWTISKNKKLLDEYHKLSVKKLPENILEKGVFRECLFRTNSKMIYMCKDKEGLVFYNVFINFVVPVPIQFWPISLYDYEEKYPIIEDFMYRAWLFWEKKPAFEKYLSLK
jgi:hypothetical protein